MRVEQHSHTLNLLCTDWAIYIVTLLKWSGISFRDVQLWRSTLVFLNSVIVVVLWGKPAEIWAWRRSHSFMENRKVVLIIMCVVTAALQDEREEVLAGYTTNRWPHLFVYGSLHCIFGRNWGSLIVLSVSTFTQVFIAVIWSFCFRIGSDWFVLRFAAHSYLCVYHHCSSLSCYLTWFLHPIIFCWTDLFPVQFSSILLSSSLFLCCDQNCGAFCHELRVGKDRRGCAVVHS